MRKLLTSLFLLQSAWSAEVYVGFDDFTPGNWNPAHGYFLKNTPILHNARVNGCYGSLRVPGIHKNWRQSTFESYREGDYLRHIENQLSYPMEAVAAFVQWCYPSPSRTKLDANVNCHDPLGVWARQAMSTNPDVKEKALIVMGGIIHMIQGLYLETSLDEGVKKTFSRRFKTLFNPDDVPLKRIDTFTDIVFEAIKGERFDETIKKLYPEGMVRRTLLAYITEIISSYADIVTIFKAAGMIEADFAPVAQAPLTKALYTSVAEKIKSESETPTLSDYVRYLSGEKLYETLVPSLIQTKRSVFSIGDDAFEFANCGEVSVLDFFITFLWDEGALHPEYLDHLLDYPLIRVIKNHITTYATLARLDTPEAHNDWGRIIANLNVLTNPSPLQKVKYLRRNKAEISGGLPSMLNLFDIIFSKPAESAAAGGAGRETDPTMVSDTFIRPWETTDLSSTSDQSLVLEKWHRICALLRNPTSPRTVSVETTDLKNKGVTGDIEFSVNGKEKFTYRFSNGHFGITKENTSQNILSRRFTGDYDQVLEHSFSQGSTSDTCLFSNFIIREYDRCNGGILDISLREDSPFGNYSRAVLFRMLSTFSYNRMDDNFVGKEVINILDAYYKTLSEETLVKWVFSNPMGEDFMRLHYLPNVFKANNIFGNAVIAYLKSGNLYNSFVDQLMKSEHPRKYQFAAFYGLNKFINSLSLNAKSKTPLAIAHQTFGGKIDRDHPLIHAMKGGQLETVKILTRDGKSPHWKTVPESEIISRPILVELDSVESLDILNFIVEYDPYLFSIPTGTVFPLQQFLTLARTPEIFEFLRSHLKLTPRDLISWKDSDEGDLTSSLDETAQRYNVTLHILQSYPEIPVTNNTIQNITSGFHNIKRGTLIVDVARIVVDRYTGDFATLKLWDEQRLFPNILNDSGATWFVDLLADRLPKDILFDGKSPYLHIEAAHNLKTLWVLARHHFSWDVVGESGKTALEELSTVSNTKTIRWMFGGEKHGESVPTEPEISACHREWLGYGSWGQRFGFSIDKTVLGEAFEADIAALRTRLGYPKS